MNDDFKWVRLYVSLKNTSGVYSNTFPSQAPNLIFLAVSPEEKESWISALSSAITRAKNRVLDEVGGSLWEGVSGAGGWPFGKHCSPSAF